VSEKYSKTKEALKTLIAGEEEAVAKYTAFNKKAKEEGFSGVAKLFEALIFAENIHIKNHRNALKEEFSSDFVEEIIANKTIDNLQEAINGEVEENKTLYPNLIKSIKKEGKELYVEVAKLSMEWAMKAESVHSKLLKQALKLVKNGKDFEFSTIKVCRVCGNVIIEENEEPCEICGHDYKFFVAI